MTIPADIKEKLERGIKEGVDENFGSIFVRSEAVREFLDILPGIIRAANDVPASKIRGYIQAERVTRRLTK